MRDFENMSDEAKMHWKVKMDRNHRRGHVWTGLLLLLIGTVALMKSYVADFPAWIFTWQMLLIVLGLFIAIRHRFHGMAWFVLLMVGGVFLARDYFLDPQYRGHIWPVILILVGVFFIFRSRQKPGSHHWFEKKNAGEKTGEKVEEDDCGGFFMEGTTSLKETFSQDDFIDTTSVFGGTKKNILTKNFKGGDIVNIFGGTELNLTQSDINGTAVLELTTIFGGTKLVIPSNWSVKSEAVTIFGGIEDKRHLPQVTDHPEKILLLRGTVIFGGIDIKSF
jgi:predicted membrane protein